MNGKPTFYQRICQIFVLVLLILVMTASAVTAASVTVRWDPIVSPHDGYRVFARKAGQAYNYSQPNWQGAVTTCTINNLQNQTVQIL